jgi:anion-transporting  ArsA/GET3 family ATPase
VPSAARLHVVTGKGGVGKTTVAGALALALARDGHRVLVLEVEGRQGLAQLFDTPPLPYEERRVAVAPGGGEVFALAVDAEQALLEYLELFYKLGRAGRALRRLGAIEFATTIAPGLRDVLLTGKAYEATRRRPDRSGSSTEGPWVYDAVVMDAPPAGRIGRFLNVNSEVSGLAKVGPVKNQASSIMDLVRSERTAVHIVTLLEQMPVQESLETITELAALRIPIGAIFINSSRQSLLDEEALKMVRGEEVDRVAISDGLRSASIRQSGALVDALIQEGKEHALRLEAEDSARLSLNESHLGTIELPHLPGGVDIDRLHLLAEEIHRQMSS